MVQMRMVLISVVLGIVSGCSWVTATASAPGVPLATAREWRIVVPVGASETEQFAAEQFQTFFAQATGTTLPMVAASQATGSIFIGHHTRCDDEAIAAEAFSDEAFRIVVKPDRILIAGGRPRGVLYGVYTFLEDYLGVRFLTLDHTHVPQSGDEHTIPCVNRKVTPALTYRNVCDGDVRLGNDEATKTFMVRSRQNARSCSIPEHLGGMTPFGVIGHSFVHQLPSATYGREHPDYYALVDGKRLNQVKHDSLETQPCLSHPDVLKIITAAAEKKITDDPSKKNVTVSQNDNFQYCRCEACAATDAREESAMGSLLQFVNAVADQVNQRHPGYHVGTLSYQYSRRPPKYLKPRDNVQIQLCSIECCVMHPINDPTCPKNVTFCRDMDGWGEICDQVFVWNYNGNFQNCQLPCPNLRVIGPNIRYFVSNGAKGIFMQGAYATRASEMSDLRYYVTARTLWDPRQDTEALIDEFVTLHYGKAGPPIRRFIARLHDQACSSGKHQNCFGLAKDYAIDDELVRYGKAAFDEALTLADDDIVRRRVEKASLCIYRAMLEPIWYLDHPTHATPDQVAILLPIIESFVAICLENGIDVNMDDDPAEAVLMAMIGEPGKGGVGAAPEPVLALLRPVVKEYLDKCSELNVIHAYIAAGHLYQRVRYQRLGRPDMAPYRPIVARFLELCETYNVQKPDEFTPMAPKAQQLRDLVGLP